jgi:hypothetical protein
MAGWKPASPITPRIAGYTGCKRLSSPSLVVCLPVAG